MFPNYASAVAALSNFDNGQHSFSLSRTSKKGKHFYCRNSAGKLSCGRHAILTHTPGSESVSIEFTWKKNQKGVVCRPTKAKREVFPEKLVQRVLELKDGLSKKGQFVTVPVVSNDLVVQLVAEEFPEVKQLTAKSISNIYQKNKSSPPSERATIDAIRALGGEDAAFRSHFLRLVLPLQDSDESLSWPEKRTLDYAREIFPKNFSGPPEQTFIFLSHDDLLDTVPVDDKLKVTLSADFMHQLRDAPIGMLTLTVQDVGNHQHLLGVVFGHAETRLLYCFGLSCLQFELSQKHGKTEEFRFFEYLVMDGFAPLASKYLASSILHAKKRDCLFHCGQSRDRKVGTASETDLTLAFLNLAKSPFSVTGIESIIPYFKTWGGMISRERGKEKGFNSWFESYISARSGLDGPLAQLFSCQVDHTLFSVLPSRNVIEATHSNLRAIVVEVLKKCPHLIQIVHSLWQRVIKPKAQIHKKMNIEWVRDATAEEWTKASKQRPARTLNLGETVYYIFTRKCAKTCMETEENLCTYDLSLLDVAEHFLRGEPDQLEFRLRSDPNPKKVFNLFMVMSSKCVIACMRADKNVDFRCSCSKFWKTAGCKHTLRMAIDQRVCLRTANKPLVPPKNFTSPGKNKLKRPRTPLKPNSLTSPLLKNIASSGMDYLCSVPDVSFFQVEQVESATKQFTLKKTWENSREALVQGLWRAGETQTRLRLETRKGQSFMHRKKSLSERLLNSGTKSILPKQKSKFTKRMEKMQEKAVERLNASQPQCLELEDNLQVEVVNRGKSYQNKHTSAPPNAHSPTLQKCKTAGIIVVNPLLADGIWKLQEMLQSLPEKYRVTEDVPGDGDCFFHAVIKTIKSKRPWIPSFLLTPKKMREEIVKALGIKRIKEEIIGFLEIQGKPGEEKFETKYVAYLNNIRSNRWADHLMILIISRLYALNLIVIHDINGYKASFPCVSEFAPSLRTLPVIIRINNGTIPEPILVKLGNISDTHFVLIEEDKKDQCLSSENQFGRGQRKPKKKMKYGFDA